MKTTLILTLAVALGLGAVGTTSATAATAAAATPKVVVFNLTATPLVKPDRFFFQANAGPYLKDLVWAGWGTAEATGSGRYIRDCAVGPCGAPGENHQDHPATFVLSHLGPCPRLGATARVYRSGRVEIDRDGTIETVDFDPGDDLCAKRPSRHAAVQALTSFVQRRFHVAPTKVTCRNPDTSDWDCVARFTRNGKATTRKYWVMGTVSGRIEVRRQG